MARALSKLMCLLCVGVLGQAGQAAPRSAITLRSAEQCAPNLEQSVVANDEYARALHMLETFREHLPNLIEPEVLKKYSWYPLMQNFAYPTLRVRSPGLFLSFLGDANSGKSTLANMTLGRLTGKTRKELGDPAMVGPIGGYTRQPSVFLPSASAVAEETSADPDALPNSSARKIGEDASLRFDKLTVKGTSDDPNVSTEDPMLVPIDSLDPNEKLVVVDAADISSGSYKDDNPRNLARAKQAIIPADVLFIMVDRTRYNNINYIKMIRRIFAEYGQRKCVLVWRGAPPEGDTALAVRFLREFAWEIYDQPKVPKVQTVMPDGVHAAYFSPDSDAVDRRDEFPELHPLDGAPSFDELLEDFRVNGEEIKRFSVDQALTQIRAGVHERVTAIVRQKAAGDIVAKALQSAIDQMADMLPPIVEYDDVREQIREAFVDELPVYKRWVHKAAGVFRAVQQLTAKNPTSVIRSGQNNRRANASRLLYIMVKDLVAGRLQVQTPERFRNAVDTFARTYNVHDVFPSTNDVDSAMSGPGYVQLPHLELLSEDAQRAIRALDPVDRINIIGDRLARQLEKDDWFANDILKAKRDQIRLALGKDALPSSDKKNTGMSVKSYFPGDVASLSLLTAGFLQLGAPSTLTFMNICVLGVLGGCGKIVYTINDRKRDAMLEKTVIPYIKQMQTTAIRNYFRSDAFRPLFDALQNDLDSVRQNSVEKISEVMDIPEFRIPEHRPNPELTEPLETIGRGRSFPSFFRRRASN